MVESPDGGRKGQPGPHLKPPGLPALRHAEDPHASDPHTGDPHASDQNASTPSLDATTPMTVMPAADFHPVASSAPETRPGFSRAHFTASGQDAPTPAPEAGLTAPRNESQDRGQSQGRGRRWALAGAGGGIVLVAAYVAAAWLLSGTAPKGTTVAGVPVGGKDHAGIVAVLRQARQQQGRELTLALGDKQAQLDLGSSGLSVDAKAMADELTGVSLRPASVWRHLSGGGGAHEAVGAHGQPLREGVLEESLRGLTRRLTVPPVDAGVTFTRKGQDAPAPAVSGGTAGTVLNISTSAHAIRLGWLGGRRPLQLPVEEREPEVTKAQAQKALDELAKPALSGPLTLQVGEVKVSVTPEEFAPALAIRPDKSGTLQLAVDGERLTSAVLAANPKIGKAPKDARIELKNGKPHIVPGVQGVTLDPEKVGPAVLAALTSDQRTASVPIAVEAPAFTTEDAKRLGVREKVSTFSTILTSNQLRTQNLRVAARTVNGTLVMPGETFSLNGVLGERTAAKGYHQAPAINGGRLVQDYGGGVSQMATTIFNNVFFAGMEDIHHKPHSFYISRYPEGREATVNYPSVDLKWRNDSKYGVLIQANVTNTVNVSFWSTKVWDIEARKSGRSNNRTPGTVYDDTPECVPQDPSPGFDVSVTRIFKKNGHEVRRETFHTSYIAEDRVVCGPKPSAKPGG